MSKTDIELMEQTADVSVKEINQMITEIKETTKEQEKDTTKNQENNIEEADR